MGTLLVMSQSAYALTISVTSAGLPSMGISLGQVSVGRRPSPGSANGIRNLKPGGSLVVRSRTIETDQGGKTMDSVIYLVGLIVVVMFILSALGLH